MELNREVLEREIAGAEAAVKAHKEGAVINQMVLDKFKEELSKLPKKKNAHIHGNKGM